MLYKLFGLMLFFASCSNVEFICPQPEFLPPLARIPEKFQGEYVIPELDSTHYVLSDYFIDNDSIDSKKLVLKSWGNFLFINEIQENGNFMLTIIKQVSQFNWEKVTVLIVRLDENKFVGLDIAATRYEKMDTIYTLQHVSVNQFQYLLNNAAKLNVLRIKKATE